jgi:hypothetical protein
MVLLEVTDPVPMLAEPAGSFGSSRMMPGPLQFAHPELASVMRIERANSVFVMCAPVYNPAAEGYSSLP